MPPPKSAKVQSAKVQVGQYDIEMLKKRKSGQSCARHFYDDMTKNVNYL
jgi:hypothetical protein